MELLMIILFFLASLTTRIILFLSCDYKYLICKKKCYKCGCWTCKFYRDYN